MTVIKSRRLREFIRYAVPLVIIPSLVLAGAFVFDRKRHILVSLAVTLFSLLLFAAGFERRSAGTRRLRCGATR